MLFLHEKQIMINQPITLPDSLYPFNTNVRKLSQFPHSAELASVIVLHYSLETMSHVTEHFLSLLVTRDPRGLDLLDSFGVALQLLLQGANALRGFLVFLFEHCLDPGELLLVFTGTGCQPQIFVDVLCNIRLCVK